MTADNGNRAVSATWLTGITFSALAAPLALFGMQPLNIPLGESTIRGRFDDYAVEYLGAAAAVSLGLGLSRLGKGASLKEALPHKGTVTQQAPPSAQVDQAVADLHDFNSPLITTASLKSSGLDVFLDEDDVPMVINIAPSNELDSPAASHDSVPQQQPSDECGQDNSEDEAVGKSHHSSERHPVQISSPQPITSSQPATSSQPVTLSQPTTTSSPHVHIEAVESLDVITAEVHSIMEQISLQSFNLASVQSGISGPQTSTVEHPEPSKVQVAAIPLGKHHSAPMFPAAQSYVSFARPKAVPNPPVTRDLTAERDLLQQVHTIRETVQRLMNQVDSIQAELEQTTSPTQRLVHLHATKAPSYTVSSIEPVRNANLPEDDIRTNVRATA